MTNNAKNTASDQVGLVNNQSPQQEEADYRDETDHAVPPEHNSHHSALDVTQNGGDFLSVTPLIEHPPAISDTQLNVSDSGNSGPRSIIYLQPPIERVPKDAESICTAHSERYTVRHCDNCNGPSSEATCWWKKHKIRENWRPMLAAFGLLIVGLFCIAMGIAVLILPEMGFQSYVFFIAGIICFIPGAYHVVFVICAIQGRKGYDFSQLPLFN